MGISALIIYWAWGILKDSTRVLLETAPKGLDIGVISDDLKKSFPEIKGPYNVHLWTTIPEMIVFSAHITFNKDKVKVKEEKLVLKINQYLAKNYDIIESTIQIISEDEEET